MNNAMKRCLSHSRATPKERMWVAGQTYLIAEAIEPTYFDLEVKRLGLGNPAEWPYSKSLRMWAKKNRRKHYIPEALLLTWGLAIGEREMNLCA
jgi:hypothetical protein